jgi:hypothetical protein
MEEVIFGKYLSKVADIIQTKFESFKHSKQNSADIGELCETILRTQLDEFFSNQYRVLRGGCIVNIRGEMSGQVDVICVAKSGLKIFEEKGVYPVESVYGVFSVTSKLDLNKFRESVMGFKDIPQKEYSTIEYAARLNNLDTPEKRHYEFWSEEIPFRCIFAFGGKITPKCINFIKKIVAEDSKNLIWLPDYIIINKKSVLCKIRPRTILASSNKNPEGPYHLIDLSHIDKQGLPFVYILSSLSGHNKFQQIFPLDYANYFNREIDLLIRSEKPVVQKTKKPKSTKRRK